MDLFLLILYGCINFAMLLWYLLRKGDLYKTPFWIGVISLGWFYPLAIGGYANTFELPDDAYSNGMLFASLCTLGLWGGWILAYRKPLKANFWLGMSFKPERLYYVGVILCLGGFAFQWKLRSLPEEVLAMTQWTGAPVMYLFLSQIFKYGFLTLWILYLNKRNWLSFRYLIFLTPCFLLLLDAAIINGRRAEMMNLVAFILVGLWFVKRVVMPRWLLVIGLICGLTLINAIGTYRSIMKIEDISMSQRVELIINGDYMGVNKSHLENTSAEFENYIFIRTAVADEFAFDYGMSHWNLFVFNYVPAQLVGTVVKQSLMLPIEDVNQIVSSKYGHSFHTGSTLTGYADAFSSFGWMGFIKFILIGLMSGVLYRYAMAGGFLAQLIYIMSLNFAMHSVSHGTNEFLIRHWAYFFILVFPVMYWALDRKRNIYNEG